MAPYVRPVERSGDATFASLGNFKELVWGVDDPTSNRFKAKTVECSVRSAGIDTSH